MNEYTVDIIDKCEELEWLLENDQFDTEMIIKEGSIPVLISAPHSVNQWRDGRVKIGEFRTAPIAEFIHEFTNCYSSYKTKNLNDDANYDDQNYYKDYLIDLIQSRDIKYVIDLHIMSPKRDYDIEIGTGRGNNIFNDYSLPETIKSIFESNGIYNIAIDEKFTGMFRNTVSSTIARECGIPCIQIELNWRLLDSNNDDYALAYIIDSLIDIVNEFSKGV